MASYFGIRTYALTDERLTLRVPFASSRITIENTSTGTAVYVTDLETGDRKRIPAATELVITSSVVTWDKDDPICQLDNPSGSGQVVVTFAR